jgi:WD40 repeat protein
VGGYFAVTLKECTLNLNNNFFRYEDSRHTDFVRGLAWDPNSNFLWSCGWDKQVLKHLE